MSERFIKQRPKYIEGLLDDYNSGVATVKEIELDKLVASTNHQFEPIAEWLFQDMVENVRADGVLIPVIVKPVDNGDKYEVLYAHTPESVAREAGLKTIPVIIYEGDVSTEEYKTEHPDDPFSKNRTTKMEIDLDNLVVSAEHPFENNEGSWFDDIVESIRYLGVLIPIIVKPHTTKERCYEILDGNKRVMAAIEVGLDMIPAIVYEGLVDNELPIIKEPSHLGTNTDVKERLIELLRDGGIDIYDSNYKKTDIYPKVKGIRAFDPDGLLTLEEYIEREVLTIDDVVETYECKYDMGNPYELTEEDCEENALAEAIAKYINPKHLVEGKQKRMESDDIIGIINRENGGLKDRLKKFLGLYTDSFDIENIIFQREKYKLYYLIWKLEYKIFPHVHVLELLSKPAMENIDNSYLGRETINGKIIKTIKDALEIELSLYANEFRKNTYNAISFIVSSWERSLNHASLVMDFSDEFGYENNIKEAIHLLTSAIPDTAEETYKVTSLISSTWELIHDRFCVDLPDELIYDNQIGRAIRLLTSAVPTPIRDIYETMSFITSTWERSFNHASLDIDFPNEFKYMTKAKRLLISAIANYMSDIGHEHSPLQTMYLKMVQYEYRGNIADIIKNNEIQPEVDYNVPPEFFDELRASHNKKVDINDIEGYLKDNSSRIAKYVYYLKPKVNKYDYQRIRGCKDMLIERLGYYRRATLSLNIDGIITELLVISCLQTMLSDERKEQFKPTVYMKSKLYFHGDGKHNGRTIDDFQIYWSRRIGDHWYANIGRNETRQLLQKLEIVCGGILLQILSCRSISEMMEMNKHYHSILSILE